MVQAPTKINMSSDAEKGKFTKLFSSYLLIYEGINIKEFLHFFLFLLFYLKNQ